MAKITGEPALHAAGMGRDVCWKPMHILGGNGLITGFPPERCFRDVIVSSIAGGIMQVLENTIAAQVLGKKLDQRRSRHGMNPAATWDHTSAGELPRRPGPAIHGDNTDQP
ncbi:acyl-CoA dehydrogenase family protein [Nocardia sp. CA-120079]|uniref:acyl-CoA dehydrogenase family protein n=1 Tax=Nocardia sp. CA-120079 TaxID=3239974 RepID=UPI003D97F277